MQVMYVGKKDRKVDNVNDSPNRIWSGLGDVLEVSEIEGRKLLLHPMVWRDVTNLNAKQRKDFIASFQDKYRAEARANATANRQSINLHLATIEELAAEIARRNATAGDFVPAKPQAEDSHPKPGGKDTRKFEKEEGRPSKTEDVAAEIFGSILSLDETKGFDDAGQPHLDLICDQLGYKVTQDEVAAVFSTMDLAPKKKKK